ncbi:heparinase II/III-family protein [bacterium]|nr:heparinase II/III-family protein [bacterium]
MDRLLPCAALLGGLTIALMAPALAQKPDPYHLQPEPFIGPAAVPVMEQVFFVQLNQPPGAPIQATCPEGVKLLDQTKPGPNRPFTRLYFRSDRGITAGSILLATGDGKQLTVPLRVFSYREDIEDKVKDTPQLDRSARKQGRSFYTSERVKIARQNLQQYPQLGEALKGASFFENMTDDQVFGFLPSWNMPRQCYSTWPCPACGEKIYEKSAFYPWQHVTRGTYKAKCPLCGKAFPSNDITKDDFTSGDTPDDGWGYDPTGNRDRKQIAGWVGLHNHHTMWLSTGGEMKRLGERYLLLGDEQAAHKAGLLLARLAYVYPGMDMTWQQVQTGYLRPGRLLVDGNWERTGLTVPAAQCYDAIFDYLDRDTALVKFLQAKDPAIKTPADVKTLIDTYLIQLFGWDWVNNRLSGGNQGARERDAAYIAVCANMGAPSDAWIEKLFTNSYNSGLSKGGFDDEMLVNTLTREGITLVNGFDYALGYVSAKSGLAEILSQVQSPKWRARCNLYDVRQYPKLRAEYDAWTEMLVAGDHRPCYGDDGNAAGAKLPQGAPSIRRVEYTRAYHRWPTDTLARALALTGRSAPDLFEPDVWPEVAEQVKQVGPAPPLRSRVLDGVGFAFLESRPDAEKVEQRAGLAFRYGYGVGHQHQDNLNVEFWAHDAPLAPELGYPCWAHPLGATGHVVHHNTGMIDRSPQYSGGTAHGTLEQFAAAPEASFADLSAEPAGFPNRVYRRAVCLADAPGGNVYLFDVFRMAGGTTRTYCFHGPAHKDFQSSLTFGPKATEPFDIKSMSRHLNNNILEPQEAQGDGDAWADWLYDKADVHLRLNLLGQPGRKYFTARYGKPDSPPIRFLFPEDTAPDGASEFVAVWQPYVGQPFIEKIERLQVSAGPAAQGAAPADFPPVAVRVTLAGGQVDTFLYTFDATTPVKCGEFTFQGSFGYWSEQDGKLRCAHLVNGMKLLKNGVGIAQAAPAQRLKITAIDVTDNIVTLDGKLPVGDALKGRMLFLRGGKHRTAWRIAEVLPPGDKVRLECNSILFRSRLDGVSDDKLTVSTELAPPIEATRGVKPGTYDGALVTDESQKARFRVARVAEGKIVLDRPCKLEDFADADGDGRRMLFIYDHGEGDEAVLYNNVFVRLENGKPRQEGEAQVQGL